MWMKPVVGLITHVHRGALATTRATLTLLAALTLPISGSPAMAQGYGSPGLPNVGLPEAALLPDLAALQDGLEDRGWMVRGQATFILQGHPAFRSPYHSE